MLVISRRIGESIIIGENAEITATITDIQGHQIKFGIEADKSIAIDRAEVFFRKQAKLKKDTETG